MNLVRIRARWVVALLVMSASLAHAQDRPVTDAPVRLGPLLVTPTLELVQFGVDTNVFHDGGDPASDYTFRGGPRVSVELPVRRLLVTASSTIDYLYFHEFANLRGFHVDLDTRAELRLRRVTLFLEDAFRSTTDRLNLEIDARARRLEHRTEAGLNVQFFPKIALELAVRESFIDFSRDDPVGHALGAVLNHTTRATAVALQYSVTPLTAVSFIGETRQERFDTSVNRDTDAWSAATKLEFHPRALMSGEAAVGYRRLNGRAGSLPSFAGLIADVGLSSTLFGSTVLSVEAGRDVAHSFEQLEPYYVADRVGFSVVRRLTQRFDVRARTEHVHHRYRRFRASVTDSGLSGRVDAIRYYSVGLARRFGRGAEIGFDIGYWSRRSNQRIDVGYDGLQIGLTSTYAF